MIKKSKIKQNIWLVYSVLFVVTALLTYFSFIVCGKTLIWNTDGFRQHYPLLVKLRSIVKDLVFNHRFSFWLDDMTIGSDTIGSMSYVFMDPFNYIAAAFPIEHIDIGYSVACVLRMFTAGITMMCFLRYHKYSDFKTVIGGLSYALCNWGVGVMNHGFFMVPFMLFPLVILGIDKVFDKKSPLILIISVALSLVTSVYLSYMTALSAFVYILVRSLLDKDIKEIKTFFQYILKFIGFVIIACLIASPILVSMLYTILNASKGTGVEPHLLPTLKEIVNFIPAFSNNTEESISYGYIGINALFAAWLPLVAISAVKKKKLPAIMCMFNILMELLPVWGMIMNGFSYRVGRWCYALAFFAVYALVDELKPVKELSEHEKKICVCWIFTQAALIVLLKSFTATFSTATVVISLWNCAFMMMFISGYISSKRMMLSLLAVNIGMTYSLTYSTYCVNKVNSYIGSGLSYNAYSKSVMRAYDDIEKNDKDYFRVDYNEHYDSGMKRQRYSITAANENLFWGARGVSGYLSTFDQSIVDFNDGVLNSTSNYNRINLYSFDNRARLNFLNGVKYYFYEENSSYASNHKKYAGYGYESIQSVNGVAVMKSSMHPALGYVFYRSLTEAEYNELSPLEKEQCLMKNVVVGDDDSIILDAPELSADITELGYRIAEDSKIQIVNGEFIVNGSADQIKLEIDEFENAELYVELIDVEKTPFDYSDWLELKQEQGEAVSRYQRMTYIIDSLFLESYGDFRIYLSSDGVEKRVRNTLGEPPGRSDIYNYMANLGYKEEGGKEITLKFTAEGKYTIGDIKIYAVPIESFVQDAEQLSANRFEITSYEKDRIIGNCAADDDGLLFVSIPYHKGWSAVVDGQETDIIKVDICYLGIPVSKGEHTVELVFRPIFFNATLVMMAAGIMLTVVIVIVYRKSEKKSTAKE